MIDINDVEKLAKLSRIKLSEEEKQTFSKEIDSILSYVNQIQQVAGTEGDPASRIGQINTVMRDDTNPHEEGKNTEVILKEAPAREGNWLKVKKIL